MDLFSFDQDFPSIQGNHPEYSFRQLCTPGSHQTCNPQNFTPAHLKADIFKFIAYGGILDLQVHASRPTFQLRVNVLNGPSNHGGNQLIFRQILRLFLANEMPIPQNYDVISNPENLVHFV